MKHYLISYTETYNNRDDILTTQHPLEWLARKRQWDRDKNISTIITCVIEITNDEYISVVRSLSRDGLILSSLVDIE